MAFGLNLRFFAQKTRFKRSTGQKTNKTLCKIQHLRWSDPKILNDGEFYDPTIDPPTENGIDGPRSAEQTVFQTQFNNVDSSYAHDPSNQNIGDGHSAPVLGNNLDAVGFDRPANSTAHHIVSSPSSDSPGELRDLQREARDLFNEANIDINEAINGVYLPVNSQHIDGIAPTHTRVHTKEYYRALIRRFRLAGEDGTRDELAILAKEIANGTFP